MLFEDLALLVDVQSQHGGGGGEQHLDDVAPQVVVFQGNPENDQNEDDQQAGHQHRVADQKPRLFLELHRQNPTQQGKAQAEEGRGSQGINHGKHPPSF